jgi:hypothetical protein
MVSAITPRHIANAHESPAPGPGPRGKSAESPGHLAKAAVATSERTDLPRNIQGQVASLIARGLDYAPLLTGPPPPEPPQSPPAPAEGDAAG